MAKIGRLTQAISVVTFITLLSKIMGFIREAQQASIFGAQQVTDRYTLAFNNTIYLFTTLAYALCVAAVPIISQRLVKSREEGLRLAGNLISVTMLAVLGITIIGTLFPYALFVTGENGLQLVRYVRIMFLSLPIIVLTYLLVAVFQSMEHFTLQGSLSLPYNVFIIGWLFFAGERFGMDGVVIVVTAAWLLQLGMTLPLVRKERIRFSLKPDFSAAYLPGFFRTAVVTGITTAIYLFCYMMDTKRAAGLGVGAVTAFYYADKLFAPLVTTLVYSASTVLFPKFNQQYATAPQDYRGYVSKTVHRMLFLILPISVLISLFANPIICVLFERGDFTRASTELTGGILGAYALGMTAFALIDLLNKAFFTIGNRVLPLVATGITLLCNLILVAIFRSGIGVALGTAISLSLGALLLLICFCKGFGLQSILMSSLRVLIASAVMGGSMWWLFAMFVDLNDGAFWLVAKCLALGVFGMIIYFLLCALMGERWFGHRNRKEGTI